MWVVIMASVFVVGFLGYAIKRFITNGTAKYRIVKETYGDGRTTYFHTSL